MAGNKRFLDGTKISLAGVLLGAYMVLSACGGKAAVVDSGAPVPQPPAAPSSPVKPPVLPVPVASTATPPAGTILPRSLTAEEKSRRADASMFLMKQEMTNSMVRENLIKLRNELYAGQYDLLDQQLNAMLQKASVDPTYDFVERDLESFTGNHVYLGLGPVQGFVIDAWLKAKPDSVWAIYAHGMNLIEMAETARGEHFADQVSSDQWDAMGSLSKKARPNIERVLKLNPKIVMAWASMFELDQMDDSFDELERDYVAAEKYRPHSILIEAVHENALEPRWGGSYEMMDGVAQTKLADLKENPRFWDLQGYSSADIGYGDVDEHCTPCDEEAWRSSLKNYVGALAYEDDGEWLSRAGDAAAHLHRYGLAYAYYKRASIYVPWLFTWNAEAQLMRALCAPDYESDKFEALKQDAARYAGIEPMEYPRAPGDCTYYQAELPWGDQEIANPKGVVPFVVAPAAQK